MRNSLFLITATVILILTACDKESSSLKSAKDPYPYEAILSCGMGQHINIIPCFAGGSSGVNTELTIGNGSIEKMYRVYNIGEAGDEKVDGLHIQLPSTFTLQAQNSHETLTLQLQILEKATGKIVFQKQAAQFGVIYVTN